jgi:hypothetical protein
MTWFFTSGAAFAAILAGMLLEVAALAVWHRFTGRGIAPRHFAGDLGAGMCLLLAALCALRGVGWPAVALCLLGAFGAHLFDVRQRWRK